MYLWINNILVSTLLHSALKGNYRWSQKVESNVTVYSQSASKRKVRKVKVFFNYSVLSVIQSTSTGEERGAEIL